MAETRCVNDTNGGGDCTQCVRDPQAPCRQCVDCGLTGRCAEHPARGWLQLRDVAAEFRELYGDDAEDFALRLDRRPLRAHDWRFHVEYGPHLEGDPRNGRVTFHDGATAGYVDAYLEREHIVLAEPKVLGVPTWVDSACCGGTGYADYAAVRCPAPGCPVPEAQWRDEVPATAPVVDELAELRRALQYHIEERNDPCQDRGIDYPCDVAVALADAYHRRAQRNGGDNG